MNRNLLAASVLSSALGLALVLPASAVRADDMKGPNMAVVNANMARAKAGHLEKCFGVNAVAKNDCAEGAHSCAGQATMARDPKSFVLLPAGDCGKIAGGHLQAM